MNLGRLLTTTGVKVTAVAVLAGGVALAPHTDDPANPPAASDAAKTPSRVHQRVDDPAGRGRPDASPVVHHVAQPHDAHPHRPDTREHAHAGREHPTDDGRADSDDHPVAHHVQRTDAHPEPAEPVAPHTDPFPTGVSPDAPVDIASLYRRAGLPQPGRSATAHAGEPATAASTAPPGTPSTPGLTGHVAPSCTGNGTDGNRVQVLYVRETDTASRYSQVLPLLRNEVANVDDAFALSARRTGGERRVRWVYDAGCVPTITEVVVADGALGPDFGQTVAALERLDYDQPDRKYLAFADADQMCGIAGYYKDDASTGNYNDGGVALHARVDAGCWSAGPGSTAAHELIHMLGGVQRSAPNSTELGHCTDDRDLMCYADGSTNADGTPVTMDTVCNSARDEYLLDCNNDDYFHTSPPAGSYLATRWNTARSTFLDTVAAPQEAVTHPTGWTEPVLTGRSPARLSAALTDTDTGSTLGDQPARVQVRWENSSDWQQLADLRTGPDGSVTYLFSAERPGTIRFQFAGTDTHEPSTSAGVLVAAQPRLTAAVTDREPDVVTGRLVLADGTGLADQPVLLQRRWWGNTRWSTVGRHTTGQAGTLRAAQPRQARAAHYRWVYPSSTLYHRTVSSTRLVKAGTALSASSPRRDRLRGALTRGDGTPLRRTPVLLQRRWAGTDRWRTVSRLTTSRRGEVLYTHRDRRAAYFRWSYAGSSTQHAAASRQVRLPR